MNGAASEQRGHGTQVKYVAAGGDASFALEAARHLAEYGVPLFIADPVLGPGGEWDPDAGAGGYKLPSDWQHTAPDSSVVDRWRPGQALCAVTGHAVDAVDVDPRNGGAESYARMERDGLIPRAYGRADTPSGGFHLLVAPLGVSSRNNAEDGVDVKAGNADGSGRGFVFLAPTVKRVKGTDWTAAY
ncbi:bifunctional DNA primase/polymerase, partial [Georgenia sp. 10Sc9-8]|nr:bifunctional DNA primase/polymerase [Georgenia halotolerans]